jgi:predicted DNA-binding antitoxin AbrB/MazE fold protein
MRLYRLPIGRSLGLREHLMTQRIEAIYTDGVLKPTAELPLRDNQRVRLSIETIDDDSANADREAAVTRLKAGVASMRFFSEGPLPSREELHDRHWYERSHLRLRSI